jgi:hypothetical protein
VGVWVLPRDVVKNAQYFNVLWHVNVDFHQA